MEYGQKAADLVAEYSLVEEVTTTQSRQLSKETAGNLSQNVKKLSLGRLLKREITGNKTPSQNIVFRKISSTP